MARRFTAIVAGAMLISLAWLAHSALHPHLTAAQRVVPNVVPALTAATGVVYVQKQDTVFRVGPGEDYDRRTPLAEGVVMRVTARQGPWLRVDLGGGDEGWVQESGVRRLAAKALSRANLRNILVRPAQADTHLDLQVDRRVAFDVIERADPPGITVKFYATTLMMHELVQFTGDPLIKAAALEQVAPGRVDLRLDLHGRGLWGWRAAYVASPRLAGDPPGHDFSHVAPHTLRLSVRWPPRRVSLDGLTVVVDAGHGGPDDGAVGVGGLAEKAANLAVSYALRDGLQSRGARVVMTRDEDKAVATSEADELSRRVAIGRDSGGTVFISVHHNARPIIEDARKARGTYIYYYRQQSADLAKALVGPVARAAGEQHAAHIWRSFHVTRQPYMPSVLLEITFISNPEMEKAIGDGDYAQRVAVGIIEGLEEFIAGRRD